MDEREPTIEHSANGLIVRAPNGHFMPGTKPANQITPANARQLRDRRYELAAIRAAEGMAAGAASVISTNPSVVDGIHIEPSGDVQSDAWALIHAVTAAQVLQSDIPRPEAVDMLGRNTGMTPRRADADDQQPGVVRLSASIPVEQLLALAQALKQNANSIDSIDAEVVDAGAAAVEE